MKKFKLFLLITFLFCFASAAMQVGVLVENGKFYDKKLVEIRGEIIGCSMARGNQVWLNVLTADGNAIGVLCSKTLADKVKVFGDYKNHGDEVLISGIFERFAPTQTGETMITAYNLQIIDSGYRVNHQLSKAKIYYSLVIWLCIIIISYKSIMRGIKYFLLQRRRAKRVIE